MSEFSIKTPWHLWVVGAISLLWNAFGCCDYLMTATHNAAYLEPYPQDMQDYWLSMPVWMWAVWAVGVFGGLFGSIALLMRRGLALPMFAASFLAALISMSVSYSDPDAPRMEGMEFMSLFILAVALLLAVYAWWMTRRGVLR